MSRKVRDAAYKRFTGGQTSALEFLAAQQDFNDQVRAYQRRDGPSPPGDPRPEYRGRRARTAMISQWSIVISPSWLCSGAERASEPKTPDQGWRPDTERCPLRTMDS